MSKQSFQNKIVLDVFRCTFQTSSLLWQLAFGSKKIEPYSTFLWTILVILYGSIFLLPKANCHSRLLVWNVHVDHRNVEYFFLSIFTIPNVNRLLKCSLLSLYCSRQYTDFVEAACYNSSIIFGPIQMYRTACGQNGNVLCEKLHPVWTLKSSLLSQNFLKSRNKSDIKITCLSEHYIGTLERCRDSNWDSNFGSLECTSCDQLYLTL